MKKLTLAIAMLVYLAVSSGVMVNFHYCMNKLDSTQLFASASKVCDKCGMHTDKSHGCCRDEVKIVKMEQDQKITSAIHFELPQLEALLHLPSSFIVASFYNAPLRQQHHNHSPPLLSEQDTYLQNNVFRI